MATRLSTLVREHQYEYLDGRQVTISAGTATFTGNDIESCDQLVQLADKAMYKAKSLGKDCISQA